MPRDIQLRVLHQLTTPLDLSLDIFITAKEAERCTPRTIETYRFSLERFREWLSSQNVADAARITPHHIRLFLVSLEKQGCAAGYIHIYARVIKTWLRFLHAEELIPANPMAKVAMPRLDKTILPAFAPEDVRHILNACTTERDRALILCLLDTGSSSGLFVSLWRSQDVAYLKREFPPLEELNLPPGGVPLSWDLDDNGEEYDDDEYYDDEGHDHKLRKAKYSDDEIAWSILNDVTDEKMMAFNWIEQGCER